MSERPFRHLCPEADKRDAMTDDEFWDHIARNLAGCYGDAGHPDYDAPVSLDATPCPTCGEVSACGYDMEGRALIHATEDGEFDETTEG